MKRSRAAVLVALVVATLGVSTAAGATTPAGIASAAGTASTGTVEAPALGAVESVPPQRVYDSRSATPLRPGETRTINVEPFGASMSQLGAWLNITATNATHTGFLTVWSGTGGRPTASTVNYVPGRAVPNLTAVRLDGSLERGRVSVYNGSAGTVDVILDVEARVGNGSQTAPGSAVPITPFRALDTRQTKVKLAAGASTTVVVAGRGGVPGTASGVTLNVTAVAPSSNGFATVHSPAVPRPAPSSLTWTKGITRATAVLSPVSAGRVSVYNGGPAAVDLLVDVTGWIAPGSTAQRPTAVTLVTPKRLLDTRGSAMATTGNIVRIPNLERPAGHWPIFAITTTGATGSGFLSYTSTQTSITNYTAGSTQTSLSLFGSANDRTYPALLNTGASVHVIVDLVGWVGPDVWLSGTVRSGTGQPVPGATVGMGLPDPTPGRLASFSITTTSAGDGTWAIHTPTSSPSKPLCAVKAGTTTAQGGESWAPSCLGSPTEEVGTFDFRPGTRAVGVELVMAPAGAVTTQLVASSDAPLTPYVLARNVSTGRQAIVRGTAGGQSRQITVDGLEPGEYVVLRYDTTETYQFDWVDGVQAGTISTEDLVQHGARKVQVTARSVTDLGTKQLALGGRIVANYEGTESLYGAIVSEDGRRMFTRGLSSLQPLNQGGLEPGTYFVCYPLSGTAACPADATKYGPITVTAGETATVTVPAR